MLETRDPSRAAAIFTVSTQSQRFQTMMDSANNKITAKLPPIHPGEILDEEFLKPMGITQYRLAKSNGVDATRIRSIVHGERSVTTETALLFSRYFGNSTEFWMGLQAQHDLERAEDELADRLGSVVPHRGKATE